MVACTLCIALMFGGSSGLHAATLTETAAPTNRSQVPGFQRRIRTYEPVAEKLLATALSSSKTVGTLISNLSNSDIIVVLQVGEADRPDQGGRTSLMDASAHVRYVRVLVTNRVSIERAVPILGHELQHVNEIAQNPDIRSQTALEDYWRRTGSAVGAHGFETAQAAQVEKQVRGEVTATLARKKDDVVLTAT